MIRVLITDDHHLFREGLARVLNDTGDIQVLTTANSGEEAIRLVEELLPDVVLMDVNMPGMGGVEATRQIRARFPHTQVLMLTVSEQGDDLLAAVRAGAHGYLLKSATGDELVQAIRRVQRGEGALTPAMAGKLMDELAVSARAAPDSAARAEAQPFSLSEREKQVLRMVSIGLTNKEIGAHLGLSPHTIKAHLRSILDKLQLRSRSEAAAWAVRHGLTDKGQGESK